ncbi:MAG TPA: hypothetical protein VHT03_15005 [Rhizomicrobium sp.]|jgi:hypothetical protein|nr:hypothetical protein [Rhizomicrobium sp.]
MLHLHLTTPEIIGIAAVIIIAIAVVAFLAFQHKRARTAALRRKFGPEYDWAMKKHGARGEAVLLARQKRVEQIRLRDLDPGERARFVERWKTLQAGFVDSPKNALSEAESVVASLLDERGYPSGDFDQRAGDISLMHPRVTDNYRAAHAVYLRLKKGEAVNTEDLRAAMVHYRSLFDELIEAHASELRQAAE